MKTLVLQLNKHEVIKIGVNIAIKRHNKNPNKLVIYAEESIKITRVGSDVFRSGDNGQKSKHNGNVDSISKNKESL